ncbi:MULTISPECIES: multifunctional transcriptional regulator/nicotinamide-nucleotide adenylyltransferase/ribosylnicotinamide kinase NadR [unclassified Moraxella]|uniref:multifunctional transcriptional regulator/nicotinamide-nucleotide adenylyltransferase/ribosylnicotinamide kinase NadR n=1 Tax=unclassified Moraxella TaxID=2685852 RepID=UPI003AF84CDA
MQQTGIIIGHFEPLHLGHVRSILHACGQVKDLYLFVTPHPRPNPNFNINLKDKVRWLTMAFADLPFVHIELLPDVVTPTYEDDHQAISQDKVNGVLTNLLQRFPHLTSGIEQPILFIDETHPLNQLELIVPVLSTPRHPAFNSDKIHANPALYWSAIHPQARPSYTKTVAIVGGESSGKTTLLHKLVNYYGASYALEMGRVFVQTDLGGTELGMQYDDYPLMATDHEQAIRVAKQLAPAPLTLVDTDFVTTQAFCEEYEGKTHPFLTACIDEFRLDYTIMLANNTPWVADGMRSLGSSEQRERFENRLKQIFARHNIQPLFVDSPDYHQRFLQAVALIDELIFHGYQDLTK